MTSSGRGLTPFVGPHPFRRDDAPKFFGREREIDELTKRWTQSRLTILHGASGVGKTSLVTAGVLPRLDATRADVLPVGTVSRPPFVPAAVIPGDSDPHVFGLLASWSPYENPIRFAGLTVSAYLRRHHWSPHGGLIMAVLDQAEDVFTTFRRDRGAHPHLLDQLSDAVGACDRDLPLRLLVVVGDEHVESLRRHDGLRAHIIQGASYRLKPLGVEPALQACRRPLEAAGRAFRPGVAERLVDELRRTGPGPLGPGAVEPLHLQLACAASWESVSEGSAAIGPADLADVDEVLAGFCHRAIAAVARDHLRGDADGLRALLRPLARVRGLRGAGGERLPEPIARALLAHHVIRPGRKHRWEMPARLVRPFLRGPSSPAPPPPPADRLAATSAALHQGWFALAEDLAGQEVRDPAGTRSRARAESLLGDAAYLQNDLGGALAHYREAARLFDTTRGTDQIVATLLTAAGRILMDQGAYRAAVTELRSAVRRSTEPVIQTELAWALWYLGQESGAVDVLDGALRSDGDTPEALRARGEILSDLDNPERALRDLDKVRPHELASTRAAYALALARNGDVGSAVKAMPPLDVHSDPATLLRAARVMKAAGRDSEAARLARQARRGTSRRPLPPQLTAEADRLIVT
ncbi:hypothetical protein ACIBIZ_44670 [Nonomuraea spiralis]|uniref:tetratricopeptide repeat protein n=1 Tax=Nonomuraea spiralis TaxID=46182 RepID=UPI0037996C54